MMSVAGLGHDSDLTYLYSVLIGPELGLQHLVHEVLGILLGIVFANASKYKKTLANRGNQLRIDSHRCRFDSLDND